MIYKATAADVRDLQRYGKENEVIAELIKQGKQPDLYTLAYFSPSAANWNWQIGIAKIGPNYYELLTRFGVVEGGRELWIPVYNMNLLRVETHR